MTGILLLVLTLSVCGSLAVRTTTEFYQAEENNDITILWDSQTKTDLSRANLICVSRLNHFRVLYQMVRGLEDPASAHKQFSRRVQLDKDALKEGQLRLYLFLVTAEDSGDYWCEFTADYDTRTRRWGLQATVHFVLNVTQNSDGRISAGEDAPWFVAGPQQSAMMAAVAAGAALTLAALLVCYRAVCRGSRREVSKTWRKQKKCPHCAAAIKIHKEAQA